MTKRELSDYDIFKIVMGGATDDEAKQFAEYMAGVDADAREAEAAFQTVVGLGKQE